LSKASPSASSMVVPQRSYSPDAAHQHDLRVARRRRAGAGRESEPVGQPRGQRMAFEMVDGDEGLCRWPRQSPCRSSAPTISPPIRPGPAVAAIASISESVTPHLHRGRPHDRPSSASTWARAAISGTTPPKAACSVDLAEHDIRRGSPNPPRRAAPRPPPSRRSLSRCRGRGIIAPDSSRVAMLPGADFRFTSRRPGRGTPLAGRS
jgi:hypothetical protein